MSWKLFGSNKSVCLGRNSSKMKRLTVNINNFGCDDEHVTHLYQNRYQYSIYEHFPIPKARSLWDRGSP